MMQSGTWTITVPAPRSTQAKEDRLLTVPEVAAYCRVCEKTIWRAIDRHDLIAVKVGTRVRIRERDMLNWLSAHQHPGATAVRPASATGPATAIRPASPRATARTRTAPAAGSFRAMVPNTQERAA